MDSSFFSPKMAGFLQKNLAQGITLMSDLVYEGPLLPILRAIKIQSMRAERHRAKRSVVETTIPSFVCKICS